MSNKHTERAAHPAEDHAGIALSATLSWLYCGADVTTSDERISEQIEAEVILPAWQAVNSGISGSDIFAGIPDENAALWAARGVAAYYLEASRAIDEGDYDRAWARAAEANYWAGFLTGQAKNSFSARARDAAVRRHAADPRQAEKAFVLECWKDWRANPTRYKSKAKFARDMLEKCQHLESEKKITDWCRDWEKSEPC